MSEENSENCENGEQDLKPEPIQTGNICPSLFLKYRPTTFNHMTHRLPWQDFISRKVYLSGSDGMDRVSVSAELGINGNTKNGNRKVSNYIHMVSRGLPNDTGFYQKSEGKVRTMRFYHKSFKPQACTSKIAEISQLIGKPCPFTVGQSISFPNTKLLNMRVTDVSLDRMAVMLKTVKESAVIPIRMMEKIINEADLNRGDDLQIDRKTLMKLALALEQNGLLKCHKVRVLEDDTDKPSDLQLISALDVKDPDDPRVVKAIADLKTYYNDHGKSFPHGTMKKFITNHKTIPKPEKPAYEFEMTKLTPVANEKLPGLRDPGFAQRKLIKLNVFHSFIYHLVYHPDLGKVPSYDDLFPNIDDPVPRNYEDMRVYDEEPDSFYRFVPPLTPHEGLPRGWFTLRMLLRAMPLSVFVLLLPIKIDDELMEFIDDPIKRHVLLSDLPANLRIRCIHKKIWSYIDQMCTMLCAAGLLLAAPDSDYISGPIMMFYCKKKAYLYDTSVVNKAYSIITTPASELKKYDYEFNSSKDVDIFWFHLRAIGLSTPLNARGSIAEEKELAIDINRGKYDKESTKKAYAAISFESCERELPPQQGAALLDPALFLHLRRVWDMNSMDLPYISWFANKYVNNGEKYRKIIEQRVQKLNLRWFSSMQCLMSSAFNEKLFKKGSKRKKSEEDESDSENKNDETEEPPSKTPKFVIKAAKGKREMDQEDIESANKSQYMRYRFTNRERDMLILLRAVSQFLNPVGKMWVEPTVIRRIMKAYFEESNDKTINALTGASVRELCHRKDDIWHLVRGLGSFLQMRQIRDRLAAVLKEDIETREEYFCQAFDIAFRLVSRDIPRLPSVLVKDQVFDKILEKNRIAIGITEAPSGNPVVERMSSAPKDESEIEDGLMYEWIINNVLNDWLGTHSSIALAVTTYKGSYAFYSKLEKLHEDGVVARSKVETAHKNTLFRARIAPSAAFLGYFSHNIRGDVFSSIISLPDYMDENCPDSVGAFLRLSNCFLDPDAKYSVHIGPDAFTNWETDPQKRNLRDTESGALKLSEVVTKVESNKLKKPKVGIPDKFSQKQPVLNLNLVDKIKSEEYFDEIKKKLDNNFLKVTEELVQKLKEAGEFGIPILQVREMCRNGGLNLQQMNDLLSYLEETFIIFACGLDTPRYVGSENIMKWALPIDGKALFIKPWTNKDGTIDLTLFRWFTEMVFVTLHEAPYSTMEHLKSYFCGVLHGAIVEEIVYFLEENKCLIVETEEIVTTVIKGPFTRVEKKETQTRIQATYNGFEVFTLMFDGIKLPEYNYNDVVKNVL